MNMNFNYTRNKTLIMVLLGLLINNQLNGQHVDFGWANSTGGSLEEAGVSLTVDHLNNTYVLGNYSGTVDFNPGAENLNLSSKGSTDVFIQKFDDEGKLLWARSIGGSGAENASGICADSKGDIYVIGDFEDTVDFDPGPAEYDLISNGNTDVFVLKLNTHGDFQWVKTMGGSRSDFGIHITIDRTDKVYFTGAYEGTADLDPSGNTDSYTSRGAQDIFVEKLDSKGNLIWVREMGSQFTDVAFDITTNDGGDCFITGFYSDDMDFDPGVGEQLETSIGQGDLFIEKLDSNGNFVWVKTVNSPRTDRGQSLDIDSKGHVVVTGYFSGTVDFDPGEGTLDLKSVGAKDAFALKLDQQGKLIWAKSFGGDLNEIGNRLTIDEHDNIYIVGDYSRSIDWGKDHIKKITAVDAQDAFIVVLTPNGEYLWARSVGGPGIDAGLAIDVNGQGDIVVTGSYSATADFNPFDQEFNLTSSGQSDAFLLQLESWPAQLKTTQNRATVSVFPNPTAAFITINSIDHPIDFVTVRDIEGRKLYRYTFNTLKSSHQVDLRKVQAGIYHLEIGMGNEIRSFLVLRE